MKHEVPFDQPTFLRVQGHHPVKIKKICFTYDVDVISETIRITADEYIRGLLIDNDTGESFLYRVDGSVIPRTPLR